MIKKSLNFDRRFLTFFTCRPVALLTLSGSLVHQLYKTSNFKERLELSWDIIEFYLNVMNVRATEGRFGKQLIFRTT